MKLMFLSIWNLTNPTCFSALDSVSNKNTPKGSIPIKRSKNTVVGVPVVVRMHVPFLCEVL